MADLWAVIVAHGAEIVGVLTLVALIMLLVDDPPKQ